MTAYIPRVPAGSARCAAQLGSSAEPIVRRQWLTAVRGVATAGRRRPVFVLCAAASGKSSCPPDGQPRVPTRKGGSLRLIVF